MVLFEGEITDIGKKDGIETMELMITPDICLYIGKYCDNEKWYANQSSSLARLGIIKMAKGYKTPKLALEDMRKLFKSFCKKQIKILDNKLA